MVASDGQVVRTKLVDVVGANANTEGDDSRVRALELTGQGDAVVLASWTTSCEVALMVSSEFDTVHGRTESNSEISDILILLKMESLLLDIMCQWLRP